MPIIAIIYMNIAVANIAAADNTAAAACRHSKEET
jgi:hypothetical protein